MQTIAENNLLPQEMIQRNQWVLWKLEKDKNNNDTKVPYRLNGCRASSTNVNHLATYDDVILNVENYSGIGYVLTKDDPYTCIDLDDCIVNGEMTKEAKTIVDTLNSYTEYSQSGKGLHIFVRAKKPGTRSKNSKKGFEMYDKDRFIIMTGNHLEGTPLEINESQETINYLYDMYFSKEGNAPKKVNAEANERSPQMTDNKIIQIASNAKNGHKFKSLYSGDISAYGSHSEADQALCNLIAFYTQDFEQIDRIFTESGLYRDKWDRDDYKGETINKAINDLTATFQKRDVQLHGNSIVIPEPYAIGKNGMLYEKKIKKVDGFDVETLIPVSRKTPHITRKFYVIESNELFYEIEWNEPFGIVKEVVPASTISRGRELLELSNKGFSVNDNNVRKIIQFLDSYQSYNNIENHHATERIGKIKGQLIHPLLADNVEIITLDHGEKQLLESFEVKGCAESWKSEVFERIKDSPKAVFMILASFASVIINDLNVPPFIVESFSGTSQGKTTLLRVVCTVWGNHEKFLNFWHSTNVSIERKAAFLNSFPFIIDDTKNAADEKILKSAIYQFSTGRSKGRGSLTGSQKEYTWQNIMLSTGEISLNEYLRDHGGAAARIIPLSGQPLKRDSDNIDKLEKAINENYGAIGIDFINTWNIHKDNLVSEYHKFKSYYVRKAKDNNVLARIANYYATVHFTGSVLKEKMGLDIDLEAISKLFDEMAEENKNTDKPMQFLEDILIDLDSDRNSIFYDYVPLNRRVKAIYKKENKQLFLVPSYTAEFLGVEEKQIREEWLKREITIGVKRSDGKISDNKSITHRSKSQRAIALNMDTVNELGFDFYEVKDKEAFQE